MSDRYNGDDYRSPRGRPDVNRTIYVGNLRYDTEEKIVRDWFEKYYGPVSFVKVSKIICVSLRVAIAAYKETYVGCAFSCASKLFRKWLE